MQEISIYHRPGPFIFTLRDKEGNPLYIGGTKDINQKVFKYAFEFSDITGYYYDETFPDFWDEVDRQICEIKPKYNSRLNSFLPPRSVLKKIKEIFRKKGYRLSSALQKEILLELSECEYYVFLGVAYVSGMDASIVINTTCERYGLYNF